MPGGTSHVSRCPYGSRITAPDSRPSRAKTRSPKYTGMSTASQWTPAGSISAATPEGGDQGEEETGEWASMCTPGVGRDRVVTDRMDRRKQRAIKVHVGARIHPRAEIAS
ncbi:hypothetical protein GCM10027091_62840 [Streptomyces daliensis]